MKKLVLLFVLCIGFAFAQAQSVTLVPVVNGACYQEVTASYTLTNALGRTFKWNMPMFWPATQDYTIKLVKGTGTLTNVLVTLWGQKSILKNDSVSIGTLNWKGSSADTVGIISNATANRYVRYYSTVKGTGTGTATIPFQALKLYNSGQ